MKTTFVASTLVLLAAPGLAQTPTVKASLKVAIGDVLPGTAGLTCSTLNDPYTNALGKVGFTGNSSGGNFVWYDDQVVWLNTDALDYTLTGAEGTMGISNSGGFIYSPTVNATGDSVWTQAGLLLNEGDPIAALPGKFSSFNSRPRMTDNGVALWPAGFRDTAGGSTTNRGFLRVANPAAPDIEVVLLGGLTYGGLTITTGASNFAYDVSGNAEHRIHILTATGSTATDLFAYIASTDTVIAREGSPAPSGTENYSAFRIPSINNHGDWALAAGTNAPAATNEIIVYNNTIIAREGDVISGNALAGTADAISINNRGRLAVIFSGAPEALYAGPVSDFVAGGHTLLKVGDQIDINNDGVCDHQIVTFSASNATAPGLDLADDGMVWCRVTMSPCDGGAAISAIIGVRDICPADFDGDGTPDFFDYDAFVVCFEGGACPTGQSADFDGDGTVDFFDYDAFVQAFELGCD
ncbi:MAG: hypothetical protein AABZ53_01285 [Planctomycetota bacterium]|mgnify:CR=1 FL=1